MANYTSLHKELSSALGDLSKVINRSSRSNTLPNRNYYQASPVFTDNSVDLLLSPNELCRFHGTGVLLDRIFDPAECFNLKTHCSYPDEGRFPCRKIDVDPESPRETYAALLEHCAGLQIRRILSVPYFPEDFLLARACKSLFSAPLAVWVMDDTVLHAGQTPRRMAENLFADADILYAISPEMRDDYEHHFHRKFFILPPTVAHARPDSLRGDHASKEIPARRCAMVGNLWCQDWMNRLKQSIANTGWRVDWFGRASDSEWLDETRESLAAAGIDEQGFVPEEDLVRKLQAYPFVIVPTGTGDESDERRHITMLSIPTRMPFLLAAAQVPVLVIGSAISCPAAFVNRFGIGLHCGYGDDLEHYFHSMQESSFNRACRENCRLNAPTFSDANLAEWIWAGATSGKPPYDRFEEAFKRDTGKLVTYIDDPAPAGLHGDFHVVHQAFNRFAKLGYRPDFVFDVGASSGIWSSTMHGLFPDARFILVEPLPDLYPAWCRELYPNFEWIESAASNTDGETQFNVSHDLYGSSLLLPTDERAYTPRQVRVSTLDSIKHKQGLTGHGILKIDVQCAEHLVLEGAVEVLQQVDILLLELTLRKSAEGAKTMLEMVDMLTRQGYVYADDVGCWRNPVTGLLEQKDVLFVREEFALARGWISSFDDNN
jgi:FkbM family methyltransferase